MDLELFPCDKTWESTPKVDWVDLGTSSRAESVTIGAVDPPSNVKFQIQRCNTRVQDSDYIPTEFRFFGHGLGLK